MLHELPPIIQDGYLLEYCDDAEPLPSLDGSCHFSRHSLYGMFLSAIAPLRDVEDEKVRILDKLNSELEDAAKIIKGHQEAFAGQLFNASHETVDFKPETMYRSALTLSLWSDFATPFFEELQLNQELQTFFQGRAPLLEKEQQDEIIAFQRMIDIERYLYRETPYAILLKLAQEEPITKKEEKILKSWIKQIDNDYNYVPEWLLPYVPDWLAALVNAVIRWLHNEYSDLDPKTLHMGLYSLVSFFKGPCAVKNARFQSLVSSLIDTYHCRLLMEDDPSCTHEWQQGDQVNQYTLAKRLHSENDDHQIYAIEGNEKRLFIACPNRTLPYYYSGNRPSHLIAKWLNGHPSNGTGFVERLTRLNWENRDETCRKITHYITLCYHNNLTPVGFMEGEAGLSEEGALKCQNPKLLNGFNFHMMEKGVVKLLESLEHELPKWNCYKKIVKESALGNEDVRAFAARIVEDALQHKVECLADILEIDEQEDRGMQEGGCQYAEKMRKKADKLFRVSQRCLLEEHNTVADSEVKRLVKETLQKEIQECLLPRKRIIIDPDTHKRMPSPQWKDQLIALKAQVNR